MKLIIDIPNEVYDWHVNGFPDEEDAVRLLDIVKNGTPLEECEDCVSRQAVLDLPKNTERGFGGKILEQSINIEYIKALPPVTPVEKVGKWIDGKCNRCGTHAPYWAMASTYYCSEYCTKCGAKMREVSRNDRCRTNKADNGYSK